MPVPTSYTVNRGGCVRTEQPQRNKRQITTIIQLMNQIVNESFIVIFTIRKWVYLYNKIRPECLIEDKINKCNTKAYNNKHKSILFSAVEFRVFIVQNMNIIYSRIVRISLVFTHCICNPNSKLYNHQKVWKPGSVTGCVPAVRMVTYILSRQH